MQVIKRKSCVEKVNGKRCCINNTPWVGRGRKSRERIAARLLVQQLLQCLLWRNYPGSSEKGVKEKCGLKNHGGGTGRWKSSPSVCGNAQESCASGGSQKAGPKGSDVGLEACSVYSGLEK